MSYAVELRNEASRTIDGLGLSSRAIDAVLDGLDQLAASPTRQLIRIGPPTDALQYDLLVDDPGSLPRKILLSFSVRYASDEETLIVFAVDFLIEHQGESA